MEERVPFRVNDIVDWSVIGSGGPPRCVGIVRATVIHVYDYGDKDKQLHPELFQTLILKPLDWMQAGDVLDCDMAYSEIREMEESDAVSEVDADDCELVSRPHCCTTLERELTDIDGVIHSYSGEFKLLTNNARSLPIQYCPWCGQTLYRSEYAKS